MTDFWRWFASHEPAFAQTISEQQDIEQRFLQPLSEALQKLRPHIFFLVGISGQHEFELILTPDGNLKMVAFIERLVAAAPPLPRWRFIALKPGKQQEQIGLEMAGYRFDTDNLFFFPRVDPQFPDEIDLVIVHQDYTEADATTIANGSYLFLENYLGEWSCMSQLDVVDFCGPEAVTKALIPIGKLRDYLSWREKEFVEKYEGTRYSLDEDPYTIFKRRTPEETILITLLNTKLLRWENKASHPWLVVLHGRYEGDQQGLPDEKVQAELEAVETELMAQLKTEEGYLNIGRETGQNLRRVFWATKDFRKASEQIDALIARYRGSLQIDYEIYRDKYWRTFDHFEKLA